MRPQGEAPYIVTINYIGDGTTGKRVDFAPPLEPKHITIYKTPVVAPVDAVGMVEKICGIGWGAFCFRHIAGAGGHQYDNYGIIDEGPGYFVVSDNGADWFPNRLNEKYTALIMI